MSKESSDEKTVPAENTELLDRRLFLRSIGKWSGAAILAVAGGAWLTSCVGGWVNRAGPVRGGSWINRRGVARGAGWINRRVGGAAGWINRF